MMENQMKYYLKDSSGLYVGSHWKTGCQLQDFAHAVDLTTKEEAETSKRNLEDFCGMKLEMIEVKDE